MMRWSWLLATLLCLGWHTPLSAQQPSPAERLRRDVALLVDPELLGRGFEGEGHIKARDLIVERMTELGLEPAGDDGGWLVSAPAIASAKPGPDVALKVGGRVLGPGAEFMPLGCSGAGAFDGALVFVAQGVQDGARDDWSRVDVTGHVALVWASDQPVERTAALALAHGARALLIVTHDAPETPSQAFELGGMPAAYVAASAVSAVLDALGPGDQPRAVPGAPRAAGELSVTRRQETVYNVVGRLPGSPKRGAPLVLGAHYDHLGLGEYGSFGARGELHAGADDNASGVAAMLEVARRLRAEAGEQPAQPVLFVAFGGEEVGLRGARRLAARLAGEPGRLINLDMVGRMREGRLYAEAHADSTHLALSEVIRAGAGLGVVVEEAARAHTSDAMAFADVGFETLHLTTGRHADYHAPGDTADLLDYEGAARIAALVELLMRR